MALHVFLIFVCSCFQILSKDIKQNQTGPRSLGKCPQRPPFPSLERFLCSRIIIFYLWPPSLQVSSYDHVLLQGNLRWPWSRNGMPGRTKSFTQVPNLLLKTWLCSAFLSLQSLELTSSHKSFVTLSFPDVDGSSLLTSALLPRVPKLLASNFHN